MPIFIAPLVGWALGALLAFRTPPDAHLPAQSPRPVVLVALFALLAFVPSCAFFLTFAEDWAYAYLVRGGAVPSAIELLVVLGDAASVVVGFGVTRHLLARRALGSASVSAVAPAVVILLILAALGRRLSVWGTHRQFHLDYGTEPLSGSSLGYALLWFGALLAIATALTARALGQLARGAPPRPVRTLSR